MANVNYNNCKDLDVRLAPSDMFYEPNIPIFAQLHTPRPMQIERMYNLYFNSNIFLPSFSLFESEFILISQIICQKQKPNQFGLDNIHCVLKRFFFLDCYQ